MTEYEPREFAISGTIHGPAFIGAEELVEFLNRGLAQATSGATVDLRAARLADAAEPADVDDSERYYLTCDGISGLPCKEHGTDCRGPRAEDETDAYVEPEPLKEGDWALVWVVMTSTARTPHDGEIFVDLPGTDYARSEFIRADAIVRPAAGQVPPWLKHAEEPVALGAAVEAEHRESDGPDRLIRIGTPADDLAYPWYSPQYYGRYGWDELTNPKVRFAGDTEGGAS